MRQFLNLYLNIIEIFEKMEINGRVVKLLHCSFGPHEHNHIIECKAAIQIWDLLQITYERTNKVKRSKTNLLMSKYELRNEESSLTT